MAQFNPLSAGADTSLGSTTRAGSAIVQCPSCTESTLVEISIKVAERPLSMRACSRCDKRWWADAGQAIDLRDVLDLTAAGARV